MVNQPNRKMGLDKTEFIIIIFQIALQHIHITKQYQETVKKNKPSLCYCKYNGKKVYNGVLKI